MYAEGMIPSSLGRRRRPPPLHTVTAEDRRAVATADCAYCQRDTVHVLDADDRRSMLRCRRCNKTHITTLADPDTLAAAIAAALNRMR